MNNTEARLRKVIVAALGGRLKAEEIDGRDLMHELGITSVDALEILISVENEFSITIDDEDLSQGLVASLESLRQYIEKRAPSA